MIGVTCALDHMHCHRVVHVDVKPDNVFLKHRAGGGYTPKLGDLGLALGELVSFRVFVCWWLVDWLGGCFFSSDR